MGSATTRHSSVVVVLIVALATSSVVGRATAGSFANLDFEDSPIDPSTPVPIGPPQPIDTALLFPSWTLWIGSAIQTTGYLNTYYLAGPQAALMASGKPADGVIAGTKSVYMSGWVNGLSTSLAQTGDVPGGTKSVRFVARNYAYRSLPVPPSPLFLRMNGQDLPLVILSSTGTGDFVFGADTSAWAGTSAELRFGVGSPTSGSDTLFGNFDSFVFSTEPIPEPGAALFIWCGSVILLPRRRILKV
jgi:hypothetical protein